MFGADKLEEDSSYVGAVHLPPPPGDRHADTVDPPAEGGHGGDAVPDPTEDTDTGSSDGSDSGSTSSSGVEIIEPPTGRHQGGTQPAFRVGTGGGGGARGNAADPVHRVADASARPPAPPSELCLWASPVLSKGRGRVARRWEWRVSQRGSPPHPNAVLCAPAPSKLRPGKDHRLNVGVSGHVRRSSDATGTLRGPPEGPPLSPNCMFLFCLPLLTLTCGREPHEYPATPEPPPAQRERHPRGGVNCKPEEKIVPTV